MEFRTKREAEEAAKALEMRADAASRHAMRAREKNLGALMAAHVANEEDYRAEAARLRALLPTLPEET